MLQRRGGDLSGGQQQQLAIGRALVLEPTLLILDEPTEGIQPNIVHEIGDIILALNRDAGVTVLLVEQKLPFARRVASEFRILEKGRCVAGGPIDDAHRRRRAGSPQRVTSQPFVASGFSPDRAVLKLRQVLSSMAVVIELDPPLATLTAPVQSAVHGRGRLSVVRNCDGRSVVTRAYATSPLRLLTPGQPRVGGVDLHVELRRRTRRRRSDRARRGCRSGRGGVPVDAGLDQGVSFAARNEQ